MLRTSSSVGTDNASLYSTNSTYSWDKIRNIVMESHAMFTRKTSTYKTFHQYAVKEELKLTK